MGEDFGLNPTKNIFLDKSEVLALSRGTGSSPWLLPRGELACGAPDAEDNEVRRQTARRLGSRQRQRWVWRWGVLAAGARVARRKRRALSRVPNTQF